MEKDFKAIVKEQTDEIKTLKNKVDAYQEALYLALMNEKAKENQDSEHRLAELLEGDKKENLKKLKDMHGHLLREAGLLQGEINQNMFSYSQDIKERIRLLTEDIEKAKVVFSEQINHVAETIETENKLEHKAIAESDVNVEEKKTEVNKMTKETIIGLRLFTYAGVGFLFLAAITFGFLTFQHITDEIKAVGLYLIPLTMLGLGIFLNKKKNQIFAMGLLGGAIGLFYISTYISYFLLHVYTVWMTLFVLLIISALSLGLTIKYKSQLLGVLSVVGVYLPVISYLNVIGFNFQSTMIAQLYILVAQGIMLVLYYKYQWKYIYIASFIGLVPWLLVFDLIGVSPWWVNYTYQLIYFGIYTAGALFMVGKKLDKNFPDYLKVIAIASSLILVLVSGYYATASHSIENLVIQVVFFFIFLGLEKYATKLDLKEAYLIPGLRIGKHFVLSFFFVIYVPLVWLVQGNFKWVAAFILLCIYGYLYSKKTVLTFWIARNVVYIIAGLTGAYEIIQGKMPFLENVIFFVCLTGFILGSHYLLKGKELPIDKEEGVLKVGIFIHGTYFLVYAIVYAWGDTLDKFLILGLSLGVLSLFYGLLFRWIKFYALAKLDMISTFVIGFLFLVVTIISFDYKGTDSMAVVYGVLAFSYFGVGAFLFSVVKSIVKKTEGSLETGYLIFVGYMIFNASFLSYGLSTYAYIAIILDIGYLIAGAAFIIIGFKRNYFLMRRVGLILSIATIAKLAIFDVAPATLEAKAIAFFAFGIISLGLSFVYQKALNQYAEKVKETKVAGIENEDEDEIVGKEVK